MEDNDLLVKCTTEKEKEILGKSLLVMDKLNSTNNEMEESDKKLPVEATNLLMRSSKSDNI